ncbi:MAG: diguanylate cyclase [Myxococcota bacterium]|nr:diguanylate cyclase [Myxococcota bacterium]
MFKAVIIESASLRATSEVHEALADAGCVDIEALSIDAAVQLVTQRPSDLPDVVVMHVDSKAMPRLHDLARSDRDLPIVAICDEQDIDAVHLAGATEAVTRPLRQRELVGRIRSAVRSRTEARHRSTRERRMSDTIVELQREKHDLERLVCVDSLTGVANRRHALSLLAAEWRRSGREHQPLGLVMIDLDCFHSFNEQYGHLGGDRCLQLACEAMVKCLRRPSDYLGRYGGEEFIAVLPNTDAVGAKIVAERLRACVEALAIPHAASQCARVVTITAGFASLHVTADISMDRLIAAADAALLRAKTQGRNRIDGDAPLMRPARVSAHRWQRFEPVVVDPWFADRIPAFLSEAHEGARRIAEVLCTDDPLKIARITGLLRSRAKDLCLPLVEQLVTELHKAASASDLTAAQHAVDELVEYVTHVQVIYRRPAAQMPAIAATSR